MLVHESRCVVVHELEGLRGLSNYTCVIAISSGKDCGSVGESVAGIRYVAVASVEFVQDNGEEEWGEWASLFDCLV